MMKISQGAVVGGKYCLEYELGSGGMGSVWAARHLALNAEVAIKFMDPSITCAPVARMRFEREATTAAQVSSDYVVKVYDYGIESDVPFIAMELLRGEDLGTRLRREGRISLEAASTIAAQIARGLRKLHEAGFVHRDLKPGNVFLVLRDDEERVKLLDFGVAKRAGGSLDDGTRTGDFVGSPHYMSPEQVQDSKSIDARCDLWSFAVILYRAVTGALPFPGDQIGAVIAKILCEPLPPASSVAPDLPPSIDAFFEQALSRDAAQRFRSARELVDAFVESTGASQDPPPSLVKGASSRGSSRTPAPRDARTSLGDGAAQPMPVASTTIPILPRARLDSAPEGGADDHLRWMRDDAGRAQTMSAAPTPDGAVTATLPLSSTQTNAATSIAGAGPAQRRRRYVKLTWVASVSAVACALGALLVARYSSGPAGASIPDAAAAGLSIDAPGDAVALGRPADLPLREREEAALEAVAEPTGDEQPSQGPPAASSAAAVAPLTTTSSAPQPLAKKGAGAPPPSDAAVRVKAGGRRKCSGPLCSR